MKYASEALEIEERKVKKIDKHYKLVAVEYSYYQNVLTFRFTFSVHGKITTQSTSYNIAS